MRRVHMSLMAAAVLAAGVTAGNAAGLEEILSDAKYSVQIRPRYEYVDQDNTLKNAKAFTTRTAVGVKAKLFGVDGLAGQVQMINVANFGITTYNPEDSRYSTIADGPQTRVTQANVSYSANDATVTVGRKMLVLDNARFIGNVGWRQMPQTYDLAAVTYNGIENLSLFGAYVNRVHRIFNTDTNSNPLLRTQFDTGSVLLHASYKVMPELTLTAYDYMIQNFADHVGIRATGKVDLNGVKLKYTAEYAVQNDPSMDEKGEPLYSATRKEDADYYNLAVDATMDKFTVGVGYEVLSDKGDGDHAFWTPLATLHAMNGWADMFLVTPGEGLKDMTVKLAYNAGEYGKIVGIYHDFQSDKDLNGQDDLGSELDIAYKYKVAKNLGLLLKYADYSAGDDAFKTTYNYVDTTKYWVQLDYKFNSK
ncbi:hypothetical protein [Nitrosophilus alvini]|uniref:hypothetical protein n=1 Tax=Nitrosophilus alvini TaxID=2714855 RepID=UPI001909E1B9|nr:hypothetical protein [Nitrosophilus alvini]